MTCSAWMSSQIFSKFSVVFLVLGCPEHLSTVLETAVRRKECSPKA
jgi:hypothetical protein